MEQVSLSCNLDLEPESVWLTVTAAQAARASIAYAQELGDFRCGPEYYTRRENLPSYLIKLCVAGEGLLEYEGQSYSIRPGDVFFIDCRRPQFYRTAPGRAGWRLLWVHLWGEPCAAYYRLFLALNDGKNAVRLESDVSARSTLEMLLKLYGEGGSTLQDDVRASALLTQLMVCCIQAAGAGGGSRRIPAYVLDTRDYIDLHYAERVTLDDLSRSISINKFYLQKLFKRYFGLSPNEYLIHTRLNRAKELLRATALPIGQIAADVGVNNAGHFISLFKRYEGITPSAYRQRWRLEDGEAGEGAP